MKYYTSNMRVSPVDAARRETERARMRCSYRHCLIVAHLFAKEGAAKKEVERKARRMQRKNLNALKRLAVRYETERGTVAVAQLDVKRPVRDASRSTGRARRTARRSTRSTTASTSSGDSGSSNDSDGGSDSPDLPAPQSRFGDGNRNAYHSCNRFNLHGNLNHNGNLTKHSLSWRPRRPEPMRRVLRRGCFR